MIISLLFTIIGIVIVAYVIKEIHFFTILNQCSDNRSVLLASDQEETTLHDESVRFFKEAVLKTSGDPSDTTSETTFRLFKVFSVILILGGLFSIVLHNIIGLHGKFVDLASFLLLNSLLVFFLLFLLRSFMLDRKSKYQGDLETRSKSWLADNGYDREKIINTVRNVRSIYGDNIKNRCFEFTRLILSGNSLFYMYFLLTILFAAFSFSFGLTNGLKEFLSFNTLAILVELALFSFLLILLSMFYLYFAVKASRWQSIGCNELSLPLCCFYTSIYAGDDEAPIPE